MLVLFKQSKGRKDQPTLTDSNAPNRAYVVADPRQTTAKEIADWVAERVAPAKRLRGGVVFLDAIPKSPAGKILRRILRDVAKRAAKESKL